MLTPENVFSAYNDKRRNNFEKKSFEKFSSRVNGLLVVGFPLDPIARGQSTEQGFAGLVINPDQQGKRKGRKPPVELQGVHSEKGNKNVHKPHFA